MPIDMNHVLSGLYFRQVPLLMPQCKDFILIHLFVVHFRDDSRPAVQLQPVHPLISSQTKQKTKNI